MSQPEAARQLVQCVMLKALSLRCGCRATVRTRENKDDGGMDTQDHTMLLADDLEVRCLVRA
jgi:hypothetical protein